jgi:hypothetical protein
MSKTKRRAYMHTIDGKAAEFSGKAGQIVMAGDAVEVRSTLAQIRADRHASKLMRRRRGLDIGIRLPRYGHLTVIIPAPQAPAPGGGG